MKRCFVVVDYQNDFVNGVLGFEDAVKIEDNICDLIKKHRNQNDDILFTFDTHFENYLDTSEGRFLPVKHCVKDSYGHKLYGKVNDLLLDTDKVFNKLTFGSHELLNYLLEKGYDEVYLCGVVTNICVISNAVVAKTALPEARICVYKDACASFDLEMEAKSYDIMKNLNIEVI